MNNLNLPPEKLTALLQMAGQKLGRDPEDLRKDMEAGQLDNILGGLDAGTADKVNSLLQNPQALEAILQNDKLQGLLGKLMGGQK